MVVQPNQSKVHSNLASRMQLHALGPSVIPLRIIVQYRSGLLDVASAVAGVAATHYAFRLISASAHTVLPSAIDALASLDAVETIWFDEPVHTMLDVSVPLIGAPSVWQQGVTGKGIKVGIVDTGIDPSHPDFAGRIALMKDFTGEGPNDNHGHGTHVAGIVGGSGAASGGKYKGVAPECLYYTAKVLRADGSGSTSDVIAGVEWAVQQGVQAINLSLGSDGACDGTDALSVTCDAAVGRGVAICVAAGNAGPASSTVGSPGCARNVITIGATSKSDQVADFSSRGPTSDNRIKPDVCFPGVSIVSCRATGTTMGTPVNASYTTASGTSMATPHATGSCALLLQANPTLSPQQVKDLLMSTAKDLGVPANVEGDGRAQVYAAYQKAIAKTAPAPEPSPAPSPTPAPVPSPAPLPVPVRSGRGCFGQFTRLWSRR
ncbi:MAG: S8 family peptidase [Chloroflexi bacterium]|nr:S8 family peptidase [Chloroflexota bacterium]